MLRWMVLLSLVIGSGCTGQGTGAIDAQLYVRQCTDTESLGAPSAWAPYVMNAQLFVGEPVRDPAREQPMNRLSIRMQGSTNRAELADALLVRISDVREAAVQLGAALPLGPATNARAALVLRNTCPTSTVEMDLEGEIRFSTLGTANRTPLEDTFAVGFGDRVAGEVHADVVDRRAIAFGAAAEVEGRIDATFDFTVDPATAAHAFP